MSTNFLYAQAPNRKGNISKDVAKKDGGATNDTGRNVNRVYQPKGAQGAPSATSNPLAGRKQAVSVAKPKDNCGCNDSYLSSSYK